ncbi:universal stress protein A-like protein isoform X2 [Carex rostrata]
MANVVESEGRKIVVAVDGGEESTFALQWCLRNFVSSSATTSSPRDTLVLVYARPYPPVYSAMDGTGVLFSEEITASLDKYSRDLADSVMNRAQKICKDYNVKVDVKVTVGDAREVLCETVEKIKADVLVLGSHGYGFIKRALIGSVSDYCSKNAKSPVLIVKRPAA